MSNVGVLLLAHNDAATIAAAVTSVAGQRRREELATVVLADDASTDNSVARACAAAQEKLPLVVLTTPSNLGPWPNLNRAMRHMCSVVDWTLILHADDITVSGWLDALLTRIAKCADDVASISTSWDMLYGEHLHETGERHEDDVRHITGSAHAVHDTLLNGCWWKISGAAVRSRAYLDVGEFDADVPQCADWDWTMRALTGGWGFEYIPRVHTIYRQHGGTMSTAALRSDVDIRDALTMVERYGHTLGKRELLGFYGRRGRYALRRLARGALQRDGKRVGVSLQTFAVLSRHLAKQLAA